MYLMKHPIINTENYDDFKHSSVGVLFVFELFNFETGCGESRPYIIVNISL